MPNLSHPKSITRAERNKVDKKLLIATFVIIFIFLLLNKLLAFDFQYEYTPFTKEQIYTIKAQDDNGVTRTYDVVGTFTYRYTTEKGDSNLEKVDLEKFISVLNELNIDLTNNHHIIQSEPLNPIYLQTSEVILPALTKFYRHTATCNALRIKTKQNKAEKLASSWKQKIINWIDGL